MQADERRVLDSASSPGNKGIVPGVVLPDDMSLHDNGKGPARPTLAEILFGWRLRSDLLLADCTCVAPMAGSL